MVVTFSDSEEYIMQKIMDVLRDESAVEHPLEPSYASNVLTFSGLVVHLKEQTVYQNGEKVALTHQEFFTLAYLLQHPGWVFFKEQIYEAFSFYYGEDILNRLGCRPVAAENIILKPCLLKK